MRVEHDETGRPGRLLEPAVQTTRGPPPIIPALFGIVVQVFVVALFIAAMGGRC